MEFVIHIELELDLKFEFWSDFNFDRQRESS